MSCPTMRFYNFSYKHTFILFCFLKSLLEINTTYYNTILKKKYKTAKIKMYAKSKLPFLTKVIED